MNALDEHYYFFASALYSGGKLDEAIDAFSTLCQRNAQDPRCRIGLAATRQEKKEYQAAVEDWKIAADVAKAAKFPDAYIHFHQAECCLSLGALADAKKALQEAKKQAGDDSALIQKIELLVQGNKL